MSFGDNWITRQRRLVDPPHPQVLRWDIGTLNCFTCDTAVECARLKLGTQERNELCAYVVLHFVTRIERGVWFVSNYFVAASIVDSSSYINNCCYADQLVAEGFFSIRTLILVCSSLFHWCRYRPWKQLNKQLLLRQSNSCLRCIFWSKSGASFVSNSLVDTGIVDGSSWTNNYFYIDGLVSKRISFDQSTYFSCLATIWYMQVLSIEAVERTTIFASTNWLLQV